MARANKKAIPDFDASYFLSAGASDKRFGRIYEGMLKSPAWQGLKPMSKVLLVVAVTHVSTSENYRHLHEHCAGQGYPADKYSGVGFLILSRAKLKTYGIDASHAHRHFQQLINAGFLELIESNQHRQQANVYRLSAKWKDQA